MDPKTLVFDIETFPLIVRVWDIGKRYITPNQIVKDWSVAAWGAKWLGAPASEVMYYDTRHQRDVRDDRRILKPMLKLLNEADVVVTQNGKDFDSKKLNARFIELGMKPPSPYDHWDTLKESRRIAKFSSHKLSYMTEKLNSKYKKLKHESYPGDELWIACEARDPRAWDEMKKYNIHDVLSTEEVYKRLRPWAPETVPAVYGVSAISAKCKTCGVSGRMEKNGTRRKRTGLYQRYQCQNCGAWFTGGKIK